MHERRDDRWRTPEELVALGFDRSRVVMMNEAHDGPARCVRTRQVGQRILPTAHRAGVRYLAMEALWQASIAEETNRTRMLPQNAGAYLDQPEMRTFVAAALALDWMLIPYEADRDQQPPGLSEQDAINWREETQARNLVAALRALPTDAKVLVWCGNGHLTKHTLRMHMSGKPWIPMGYQFKTLSGVDPFAIDQTKTVFSAPLCEQVLARYRMKLESFAGTAGFLRKEIPLHIRAKLGKLGSADAFVLSTSNTLEY